LPSFAQPTASSMAANNVSGFPRFAVVAFSSPAKRFWNKGFFVGPFPKKLTLLREIALAGFAPILLAKSMITSNVNLLAIII
jgi:hypothetical protein